MYCSCVKAWKLSTLKYTFVSSDTPLTCPKTTEEESLIEDEPCLKQWKTTVSSRCFYTGGQKPI